MNEIMKCKEFFKLLDAYLDDELDERARSRVECHAKNCPQCGSALDSAARALSLCATLDDELSVPLGVQALWRAAIRGETRAIRGRGIGARLGGLSAVAAALFLVVVGGTMVLRNVGGVDPLFPVDASPYFLRADGAENSPAFDGGANFAAASPFAPETRSVYATDGAASSEPTEKALLGSSDSATGGSSPIEFVDQAADLPSADDSAPSGGSASAKEQKQIRTASRSIETSDFVADLQVIRGLIQEFGGFEDSFYEHTPQGESRSERRYAELNARVPSDQAEDFLRHLDSAVTVVSRSENAQNITAQYYDATARLEGKEALRETYTDLLSRTQSVEDVMSIQRELNDLQTEIESIEAALRGWNDQVSHSLVVISLQEVADQRAVQPIDPQSLGTRIQSGFYASVNAVVQFAQDALVFVAFAWPGLILLIAAILIVYAIVRRRKNR